MKSNSILCLTLSMSLGLLVEVDNRISDYFLSVDSEGMLFIVSIHLFNYDNIAELVKDLPSYYPNQVLVFWGSSGLLFLMVVFTKEEVPDGVTPVLLRSIFILVLLISISLSLTSRSSVLLVVLWVLLTNWTLVW